MSRKIGRKTKKNQEKNGETQLQSLRGFKLPQENIHKEPKSFSLSKVKRMIREGKLEVPHEFQREEIYGVPQKQALIETALSKKPIPTIVLYQPDANIEHYIIVDGQQRLSSFRDLFDNKIVFHNYNKGSDDSNCDLRLLNGYTYSQLTEDSREEVNDLLLDFQILSGATLDEIQRYYTLLNSTSQPLSPGELIYAVPNPAHKFFIECSNLALINKVPNYRRKPKWFMIAKLFYQFQEGDLKSHSYIGKPKTTMLRFFNSVDEHTMSTLWDKVRHLLNRVESLCGDCGLPYGATNMFNWICAIGTLNEKQDIDETRLRNVVRWATKYMKTPNQVHPKYQPNLITLAANEKGESSEKTNVFCTTFEELYNMVDEDVWENLD